MEDATSRAAFRRLQLQDEKGQIPADAWIRAFEQKEAMPVLPESWREYWIESQTIPAPPPLPWVPIGPGNIGGRIRSIVIHPASPDIMWVGGVTGGIWKSLNGGASWTTNTDFIPNLNVTCMVADPTNPDVIYAGTGGETHRGNGIFKTTDGGTTWTQMPATRNPNFYAIYQIAISPTNPNNLLVATYPNGIFRSTDAGIEWTQSGSLGEVFDVHFHPTLENKCIASDRTGHAYYSEDRGVTWLPAIWPTNVRPLGTTRLSYAKSNPSIVYALTEQSTTGSGRLYRSEDGGRTFNVRSNCCNTVLWYANCLWVDPIKPNTVLFGGSSLFRSFDGGLTGALQVYVDSPHVDHQIVVAHPDYGISNNTVFCGTDGGLYKAKDILSIPPVPPPHGQSWVAWTSLNNGLGITQFLGGAGNAASGTIIGGTQDNGTMTRRINGGHTWTRFAGGDGGPCAADQTDPNYFYGAYQFLGIFRSEDGGLTQDYIGYNLSDHSNWTAPFILDPNDQDMMLAGGAELWRSYNIKAADPTSVSWTSIKPALVSPNHISAIAVENGNPDNVWVGHNFGDVFYTQNGRSATPTWTRVQGLPHRYVSHIEIGNLANGGSNDVYITFGGFTSANIWKGQAGGPWTDIATNRLPQAPVYSLVVSPRDSNVLYLATEIGVFASSDKGAHWSPGRGGPANVVTWELFWMGDKLVAVTFGRGMFTLGPEDD